MKNVKNRFIPFGYQVKNGVIVIVPSEAEIIQKIFDDYLSGMSFQQIALLLTEKCVEYLPHKSDWNKNRVARLIADVRYIGNDVYTAIIDREIFDQVQNMKLSRNTQTEYDRGKVISPSVVSIVCGKCGCAVRRLHDNRRKNKQRYVCTNEHCGTLYRISEDKMLEMITELLSGTELVMTQATDEGEVLEIHRLQQEAARAIDYCRTDAERARSLILECANKRYQATSKGGANADKLRRYLNSDDMVVDRRMASELMSKITLITDEQISITLINGQTIGKENRNGADNTGRQDGQGNPTADQAGGKADKLPTTQGSSLLPCVH